VNAVHKVRTSTRSLETTFTTLGLASKKNIKRLLRDLKLLRKRAGKVRDMDVLTADALTLHAEGEQDCLVQLLEYLGERRNKSARKLRLVIERTGPQLRKDLKRNSRRLEKLLRQAEQSPAESDATRITMAKALLLSSELNRPVHLNKSNLHAYRLKVKELQNVLKLPDQSGDHEFLEKLTNVKDAIGDWHDWEVLIELARQLLDHDASCQLLRQLRETSNSRYERALSLAGQLRNQYLRSGGKRLAKNGKKATLSIPVLRAATAIAQH